MQGVRIRHPVTGRVLLTVTDRITRIIHTNFSTGLVDGSLDLSQYAGIPIFHENNLDVYNQFKSSPAIWIDGSVIRWTFNGLPSTYRKAASLMIGVR